MFVLLNIAENLVDTTIMGICMNVITFIELRARVLMPRHHKRCHELDPSHLEPSIRSPCHSTEHGEGWRDARSTEKPFVFDGFSEKLDHNIEKEDPEALPVSEEDSTQAWIAKQDHQLNTEHKFERKQHIINILDEGRRRSHSV